VDLDAVAGEVDLDAVAGEVDLDAVAGEVDLDAVAGEVDLDEAATKLSAPSITPEPPAVVRPVATNANADTIDPSGVAQIDQWCGDVMGGRLGLADRLRLQRVLAQYASSVVGLTQLCAKAGKHTQQKQSPHPIAEDDGHDFDGFLLIAEAVGFTEAVGFGRLRVLCRQTKATIDQMDDFWQKRCDTLGLFETQHSPFLGRYLQVLQEQALQASSNAESGSSSSVAKLCLGALRGRLLVDDGGEVAQYVQCIGPASLAPPPLAPSPADEGSGGAASAAVPPKPSWMNIGAALGVSSASMQQASWAVQSSARAMSGDMPSKAKEVVGSSAPRGKLLLWMTLPNGSKRFSVNICAKRPPGCDIYYHLLVQRSAYSGVAPRGVQLTKFGGEWQWVDREDAGALTILPVLISQQSPALGFSFPTLLFVLQGVQFLLQISVMEGGFRLHLNSEHMCDYEHR
jgi:hypothetical protein